MEQRRDSARQGVSQELGKLGSRTETGEVKRGQIPDLDTEYGRHMKFNHQEVMNSKQGETWVRPDKEQKWSPNWDEDEGAGQYPEENHYFYLPRICNHCTHPACLDACPRGSIYKREEDGIVLVDQDKCHGYRFCVEACPYKKAFFDPQNQVAAKCIFCFPRVDEGVAPACARQCPGRLRFVGMLDDEEGPIWKLVEKWKVALPLHAEFGLEPNVFYVPPMSPPQMDARGRPTDQPRIPLSYLESLFGPRVKEVLEIVEAERAKKKAGEESELMDLLIAYDWNENFKLPEPAKAPA